GRLVGSEEDGRLVDLHYERLGAGRVLLPGAVEVLDGRAGVSAVDPLVADAELELGQRRIRLDRVDRAEQPVDVDAVDGVGDLHGDLLRSWPGGSRPMREDRRNELLPETFLVRRRAPLSGARPWDDPADARLGRPDARAVRGRGGRTARARAGMGAPPGRGPGQAARAGSGAPPDAGRGRRGALA